MHALSPVQLMLSSFLIMYVNSVSNKYIKSYFNVNIADNREVDFWVKIFYFTLKELEATICWRYLVNDNGHHNPLFVCNYLPKNCSHFFLQYKTFVLIFMTNLQ